MKNEIGRKLTSLTLMTIMFAGGLAVGAPTMFPDTDAQASQKLFVSTTQLQGSAILEIKVSDPAKSETSDAVQLGPVTVNGNQNPLMVQATDGNWYAYVADLSQVVALEAISAHGMDYGDKACTSGIGAGGAATMIGSVATTGITPYVQLSISTDATYTDAKSTLCLDPTDALSLRTNVKGSAADVNKLSTAGPDPDEINMLQNPPTPSTGSKGLTAAGNAGMELNSTSGSFSHWPLIQSWELDGTNTVCYADECIDVDFGSANDDTSITVNKATVTDNDMIIMEITDPGLNLDPTFPDEWTLNYATAGSETLTWRGNMTDTYGGNTALSKANMQTLGMGEAGFLTVTDSGAALIEPTTNVVTIYETGANTGVFTSLMTNDTSDVRTGAHGTPATIDDVITLDYAGNKVNMVVAYTDMSMTFDAGDEWVPGEEATLTIIDPDSNKMATSAETLDVNNEELIGVPAIQLGKPYHCNDWTGIVVGGGTGGSSSVSLIQPIDGDSMRCKFTTAVTASATETWINVTMGQYSNSAADQDSVISDNIAIWENDGSVYVGVDVSEMVEKIGESVAVTSVRVEIATNITQEHATGTGGADFGTPGHLTLTEGNTTGKGVYRCVDIDHSSLDCTQLKHSVAPVVRIAIAGAAHTLPADTYGMSVDIMHFDQDDSSIAHDAVYRIEAEETGDDTGVFEGTVAYANMGGSNSDTSMDSTIVQNDADVILGIHSGVSGTDAPRVQFNDTDSVGTFVTVGAQIDTNNYTGIIEWDQTSYATGDTAIVTFTDPDLNQDNALLETYTNDSAGVTADGTGSTMAITCLSADGTESACIGSSSLVMVEDGSDSGTFVMSFVVPSSYSSNSVIGSTLKAKYYDTQDAGGNAVTITETVTIASSTGSVTLDKAVYPTPWGGESTSKQRCGDDGSTTDTNCKTYYGNITVWATVHEPDNTNDTLACESADCVVFKIAGTTFATAGNPNGATDPSIGSVDAELGVLSEITQGSQDYEIGWTIQEFPRASSSYRVLSGDVLQVTYTDPADATGVSLAVYDSATFDMRNGTASFDKDTYVLGADMTVTINDPDLNIDSSTIQTFSPDFLEWDSSASSSRLLSASEFDCSPSNMTETGEDTGVFQTTCTFPSSVNSSAVEQGEVVTLTYSDRSVAGEDTVGDSQEDIEAFATSSNFGAIVELDKAVYSWTDRVVITVTAPDHNKESASTEQIGTSSLPVNVSSRAGKMCSSTYTLRETGSDTGVFYGEVVLTGYSTSLAAIPSEATNTCTGPTSGTLALAAGADGVTVSYEYSNNEVSIGSAITSWNIAEVSFGESSVGASSSVLVQMVDPDWDLSPDVIDTKAVDLTSDSDSGGIQITLSETDEDTGIFEGTLFTSTSGASSGSILRVSEGDTITLEFEDTTLPSPYGSSDTLTVAATATVGTAFPPLERAPAANARVVDAFGNSVAEVSVDQQVQIAADVANGQSKDQSFAYLVQVQDASGVTVSLSWITGSLTSGQSLSPAMSWIPTASGSYTATVFVWESVDNPTALSPTTSVDIDVV